jgi:2-iminobutanoate/2-iminopropanoate deaminase
LRVGVSILNSKKQIVTTSNAPKPIGPYSQGIIVGDLVFTAGQGAIDPKTNQFLGGSIKEQTSRVLQNIQGILEEAGSSLDNVIKVNVFLKDNKLFGEMNEVYATYFKKDPPARTTVITGLPRDEMLVEIEVIATL